MPSNRDAVLQTAELLQEILLQLDMRTLLTAGQLVSRQWHELISNSPVLQQALYFEPAPRPRSIVTQNPLLIEAFPLWFLSYEDVDDKALKRVARQDFANLPMARDDARKSASMHPDASWRRMLVRQPPVLRLGRWTLTHARGGDGHQFGVDKIPDGGLRMSHLYDLTQSWANQTVSSFRVFWDPSVVPAYGNKEHGHRMDLKHQAKIRSLATRVDIVSLMHYVVQCTGRRQYPEFEEAFAFPRLTEEKTSDDDSTQAEDDSPLAEDV